MLGLRPSAVPYLKAAVKFNHKANFAIAVLATVFGILINLFQFGNILAAVLGAGTVTFVISMVFNYAVDVVKYLWTNRKMHHIKR